MSIVAKRLDGSRWHLAWRWALVQATLCYMGTQLYFTKRWQSPLNFRPIFIVAKRWMHEDDTMYRGRPQPGRLCVRWRPSPVPKMGRSPQFLAHVYCDQTTAWITMPFGTEVDLGLRDSVLDGDAALPPLKGYSPQFSAKYVVAKRLKE